MDRLKVFCVDGRTDEWMDGGLTDRQIEISTHVL